MKYRYFIAVLLCLMVTAGASAPVDLTDRIHAVLMAQPRHTSDQDENPDDREARLREVAASVAAAVFHARCEKAWAQSDCRPVWRGDRLTLAAAVLAMGWHETRWASRAQDGRCLELPKGQQCDRDPKTGEPRAFGPWQQWRVSCAAAWNFDATSPDALRAGAWCATRRLAIDSQFCSTDGAPDFAGAFGRSAAKGCSWVGSTKRVATMLRLSTALRNVRPAP